MMKPGLYKCNYMSCGTSSLKMKLLLVIAILLSTSLVILATSQTCSKSTVVGVGYNLIYGNPQEKRDPGLKRTRQILKLTYNGRRSKTINGKKICIPHQAKIVASSFCTHEEETKIIAGTQSYRKELELGVSVGGEGNYGLASFSFSLSQEYKEIEEGSVFERKVYMDKQAYCYSNDQRYKISNIGHENKYGVSREFYRAFMQLPKKFNKKYYRFLNNWGTHIVVKATMGGHYLERNESTLKELYSFAEQTDSTTISASGSYAGYGASLDINLASLNRQISSSSEFGDKKLTRVVGLSIRKSPNHEGWEIDPDNTNAAEPTKLELMSIAQVCSKYGYWKGIAWYLSPKSWLPLKKRCNNLKKALETYAEYNKLKKSKPDDMKIPLVWPDGTYGLPRPKDGRCPTDYTWDGGVRLHSTDFGSHWSNPLDLKGYFRSKTIRHEFCIKKTPYPPNPATYHISKWPKGSYCIYKYGDCPSGFEKPGYIFWNDRNYDNQNRISGTVPDGEYNGNTKIYFCCRRDASYTIPIYLPTERSFFLFRVDGSYGCQEVVGMNVRDEWVFWHSAFLNTNPRGGELYPYDEGNNYSHKIHFCYYYPK